MTTKRNPSRPVPSGRWPSRRRLAPSGRGFRQRELAASAAAGGERRARQVRHGVSCRRPDQRRRRPSLAHRPLRAADGAGGACRATSRIGLAATASTTYGEPFHAARAFASLDHLSNGRAAWNAVTTSYARTAANFGVASRACRALRHRRGIHRCGAGSGIRWDDGAFPKDKANGVYADPSKLHVLDHKGKYFSVKGPLNISRPPQGHPIIMQSGSSGPARRSPPAPPTWCSPRTRASRARRLSIAN